MATIELRAKNGTAPETVLVTLMAALQPNESDMALAGQIIRSDIREKTAEGIDVGGVPFQAYVTGHPYYYNPDTRGGKFTEGMAKKRSRPKWLQQFTDAVYEGQVKGVRESSTERTIRFESYGAFKAMFRGSAVVDLMGIQAPHMLDAIVVTVNGQDFTKESSTSNSGGPAGSVTIAIYDTEAAKRASGHNNGTKTLPRRHFFGISNDARQRVANSLERRLLARARRALKGL